MKWQINEWGAFSMGLNSSFRWKISKKFHLDRNLFRNKKIMWHIMWWKLVSLGLIGIQILKIIFMSNLGKVFESLTKKFQVFKDLKFFGVSGFSFCAIEPIQKDENDGKKVSFQWQINEWSAIFMGLNWWFRWEISNNFYLDKEFFSRKQWTSLAAIVWKK